MYKKIFFEMLQVLDQNGFHMPATTLKSMAELSFPEGQARAIIMGFAKALQPVMAPPQPAEPGPAPAAAEPPPLPPPPPEPAPAPATEPLPNPAP